MANYYSYLWCNESKGKITRSIEKIIYNPNTKIRFYSHFIILDNYPNDYTDLGEHTIYLKDIKSIIYSKEKKEITISFKYMCRIYSTMKESYSNDGNIYFNKLIIGDAFSDHLCFRYYNNDSEHWVEYESSHSRFIHTYEVFDFFGYINDVESDNIIYCYDDLLNRVKECSFYKDTFSEEEFNSFKTIHEYDVIFEKEQREKEEV